MTDTSCIRSAKKAGVMLLVAFLLGIFVPSYAFAADTTQNEALSNNASADANVAATASNSTDKAEDSSSTDLQKSSADKAASKSENTSSNEKTQAETKAAKSTSQSKSQTTTLTAMSVDSGSFSSAKDVSIGATTQGTLTDSGLVYSFNLSQSGKLTISTTVAIDRSVVTLYDQDRNEVGNTDLDWNADFKKAQSTETWYLSGGKYYIEFSKRYNSTVAAGLVTLNLSYKKSIETFPETQTNNDDASGRAHAISVNKTYYGFLANNDKQDWYAVTLPSSGRIKMISSCIDNPGHRYAFDIYSQKTGEDLGTLASSTGETTIDLARGTYYIRAYYYSFGVYDVGDYSMSLAFASANETFAESDSGNNNTASTANAINLNTAYKGQIAANDEKDYYKFQITAKTPLMLSLITDYGTGLFEFYNSDGKRIAYYNPRGENNQGSAGKYHNQNMGTFNPGTYYFMAGGQSKSAYESTIVTGNYQFMIHPQHSYKNVVTKATLSKNGKIVKKCICGDEQTVSYISRPTTIKLSASTLVYNGKVRAPKVTVKSADGKTISSKYYTVTYSKGRKAVGTYTAKIVFKGNYSGTVTRSFKIIPKQTSISKLSRKSKGFVVNWKKQNTQATGYQIQYSKLKNFSSKATKTVSKVSTTKLTVSKLAKKTKYYVKMRTYKKINGKIYYSKWSSVRAVWTK